MHFVAAAIAALVVVSSVQPLADTDVGNPPRRYPHESAVLYSRPFLPARSETVCVNPDQDIYLQPSAAGAHRLLVSGLGVRYVLSPAVDSGSFASFRYAVAEDGSVWATKEVAQQGFAPTSEQDLRRELGLWEHVGRDVTVRDVLQDEHTQSLYVVTTLLDGNVATLAPQVNDRALLARGVLKRVASDATELHELGFVHHDIRAPNIFWDQSGRIVLADYGIARHVDEDGFLERAPWSVVLAHQVGVGVADVVAAPEVKSARHDARADSWSLAITTLHTLLPDHPMLWPFMVELMQNSAGYAEWRGTLLNHHREIDLTRVVDPTVQSVPARQHLFHAIFFAAKQADPALTQRILQHLLVTNPAERWSAEQLAQATSHEGPSEAELAPMLRQVAEQDIYRQNVLRGLRACARSLQAPLFCDAGNRL